ncbi:MAG: ribonuclease R [Clostridiales bacterium]|nr:ribonuclease R [Clostridiales bacterium]
MKYETNLIEGILSKHRRGFAFVKPDDPEIEMGDIFIPPAQLASAMSGDRVLVRLETTEGNFKERGPEGQVVKILSRAVSLVPGTFFRDRGFAWVIPADKKIGERIRVEKKDFNGAKDEDKVVVKLTRWPQRGKSPEGKVMEILSRKGQPGGDVEILIRAFGVEENWPPQVSEEVRTVPKTVREKDLAGRRDLRDQVTFTIDGADAKDLDDAVSLEKTPSGNYLLGVHIADVSHYVREDSPLDLEAFERGCSVYLLNKVIPMLPKALSNGICSLNAGVDRLTLSVTMEIDPRGKVVSHDIFKSVIRTRARMVYDDVSDILEHKDPVLMEAFSELCPYFFLMEELAQILRENRQTKGSINFDFDESEILLDSDGFPVSVDVAQRRTANRLIEEFMLAANETVAEHFRWMELPFVYRVHEKPDADRMAELRTFLSNFGIPLKGSLDNVHPAALNQVLNRVKDTPEENIVGTVMLRSMKKAFYHTTCSGHFGLGMENYCHFTSPIRRYPDLIIHRIIKEALALGMEEERRLDLEARTEAAAAKSSARERRAEELEREVHKLKKAQYMEGLIGEEFDGIISGVARFGLFVQLENTVEGMVPLRSLDDDYYRVEMENYRVVGRHTERIYALGDRVRIRVEEADPITREIFFSILYQIF